ncbi:Protein of unknown function [Gryllus bimaculatus]|nr:Protein of unknown function [Gryllus bimaculatus]
MEDTKTKKRIGTYVHRLQSSRAAPRGGHANGRTRQTERQRHRESDGDKGKDTANQKRFTETSEWSGESVIKPLPLSNHTARLGLRCVLTHPRLRRRRRDAAGVPRAGWGGAWRALAGRGVRGGGGEGQRARRRGSVGRGGRHGGRRGAGSCVRGADADGCVALDCTCAGVLHNRKFNLPLSSKTFPNNCEGSPPIVHIKRVKPVSKPPYHQTTSTRAHKDTPSSNSRLPLQRRGEPVGCVSDMSTPPLLRSDMSDL